MKKANQAPSSEIKTKRRNFNTEDRKEHIIKWRKSGLTMTEYCRQNAFSLSSLSAWARSSKLVNSVFKPVVALPKIGGDKSPNNVEIIVGDRIKIRFQNANDTSELIAIIRGLMVCS